MKSIRFLPLAVSILLCGLSAEPVRSGPGLLSATTAQGRIAGVAIDQGVTCFLGVPYAQPPVGELRWREPQPPAPWSGVRPADHFRPHAMQRYMWSDISFRAPMSEDCLYLNIWTPAQADAGTHPVLVYFHGGAFVAGSGDETRYDGAQLARRGVVVVTINYRLGVFGFLAHPDLSRESPEKASGNYGFLDQNAALRWIQENIHAFGGDPNRVTIGGQSAGAASVVAHLVSPLSRGLFGGAIIESGSIFGAGGREGPKSLSVGEAWGVALADSVRASSLTALRALPASDLLSAAAKMDRIPLVIDGRFIVEDPFEVFFTGRQADVPLLAGATSAEVGYRSILGKDPPTVENYRQAIGRLYGDNATAVLAHFPAATDAEVMKAATDLASDRFAGLKTWKVLDLHAKTSGQPVFRFIWNQPLPRMKNSSDDGAAVLGAPHSSELAYLFGNLDLYDLYPWTESDVRVSENLQAYIANFVMNGNPNGDGLPVWPWYQASIPKVMMFEENTRAVPEPDLKRHMYLDSLPPQGLAR